jgi:tetratricopeptide (TPR) repeat protein
MKREAKIFSKLIITATFVGIFLFLVNGCSKEEIQKLRSENEAIKNEEQITKKENEALRVKIASLEQEIVKLKETAEFHYQKGADLLKENKYEEAKAEFDTVIEKYPDSPFVSSTKENLKKVGREIRRVEAEKLAAANAQNEWYFRMKDGTCKKASQYPPSNRALNEEEGSLAFLAGLSGHHISSPADLIKACRKWEIPYHVKDRAVDGKAVEATVTILRNRLVPSFSLTFYRLESCKEAFTQEKEELRKYK